MLDEQIWKINFYKFGFALQRDPTILNTYRLITLENDNGCDYNIKSNIYGLSNELHKFDIGNHITESSNIKVNFNGSLGTLLRS